MTAPRSTARPAARRRVGYARLAALTSALALAAGLAAAQAADPGRTPSPAGAELYFISPANGDVLASPVTVRFGLRGMGVAPATVEQPNTGHHHLVIDAPLPDFRVPIPADDHHRHFGGGQTEMSLDLPPGQHTLQLILGDFRHVPHDPAVVSDRIQITIE